MIARLARWAAVWMYACVATSANLILAAVASRLCGNFAAFAITLLVLTVASTLLQERPVAWGARQLTRILNCKEN